MPVHPCPYPRCSGPDGQPFLTNAGICERCREPVARDLRGAPRLYVQLHLALAPTRAAATDEKVSGTHSAPLPLRQAIFDAAAAHARVLIEWETVVREAQQLSTPSTAVRESYGLARAVQTLEPRLEVACRVSPDHALGLTRTTAVGRRLLGLGRLIHRLNVPCPDCGLFSLDREDGAAFIRCRECGATWAEELYAHFVDVVTSQYTD